MKSMNVKTESVNRDLTAYKGILSKLNAAKELMAELLAREKKKAAERFATLLPCTKCAAVLSLSGAWCALVSMELL